MTCTVKKVVVISQISSSELVVEFYSQSLPSADDPEYTAFFSSSQFFNTLPDEASFRVSFICIVHDCCCGCVRRRVCLSEVHYSDL